MKCNDCKSGGQGDGLYEVNHIKYGNIILCIDCLVFYNEKDYKMMRFIKPEEE